MLIIEEDIEWNRLRAPAVDAPPPYVFHVSDCLNDLKVDDHFEIQWRKSKEFPYVEASGIAIAISVLAIFAETALLEFKQYTLGSRWRQKEINIKDHREVGNEANGFYGGIRKLYSDKKISLWKSLWPSNTFE
ncbi:hypothetical protein HAX54_046198 [Datura stramonium]|uniref:Uncharacterized protein n=1 Tax=Datura stramonium TaxID=4076 RepID=A0ABS8WLG0_DATST|nr:hypothetical protein [Datura stramonium]